MKAYLSFAALTKNEAFSQKELYLKKAALQGFGLTRQTGISRCRYVEWDGDVIIFAQYATNEMIMAEMALFDLTIHPSRIYFGFAVAIELQRS